MLDVFVHRTGVVELRQHTKVWNTRFKEAVMPEYSVRVNWKVETEPTVSIDYHERTWQRQEPMINGVTIWQEIV